MCFLQCESVSLFRGLTGLLRSPGEVNSQFAQAIQVPSEICFFH